jgi:glycolate oxidase FAD binding subunit
MVGSLGTLGLITSVTFRLHPLPEEELTILLPGRTAAGVRAVVSGIRLAQIEPASVVAVWREDGRFDVGVRFEGFRAGVAEQRQRLEALSRAEAGGACEIADETAARAFWARHDALRTENSLRGRLALLPAQIEAVAAEILPELLSCLDDPGFAWYATLGLGFVSGSPRDAGSASAAILAARGRVAESGGTLTLDAAPAVIRERVDVWGPAPAALPLMRSMKDRLDPQRRFAPGRFVGGI